LQRERLIERSERIVRAAGGPVHDLLRELLIKTPTCPVS
jgi:hypothetical protein